MQKTIMYKGEIMTISSQSKTSKEIRKPCGKKCLFDAVAPTAPVAQEK